MTEDRPAASATREQRKRSSQTVDIFCSATEITSSPVREQQASSSPPPEVGCGDGAEGLRKLIEGQGRAGRCIPRHRQAGRQSGRQQKSSGGLKGCRNVEGFRGKQQEATWSSGQGLSHPPPPLKGPPPLSPPSPGLPPPSPQNQSCLFFLACLVVGCVLTRHPGPTCLICSGAPA